MLTVSCDRCLLVWQEQEPDPTSDEPLGSWAFQCPRCSHTGAADATVVAPDEPRPL